MKPIENLSHRETPDEETLHLHDLGVMAYMEDDFQEALSVYRLEELHRLDAASPEPASADGRPQRGDTRPESSPSGEHAMSRGAAIRIRILALCALVLFGGLVFGFILLSRGGPTSEAVAEEAARRRNMEQQSQIHARTSENQPDAIRQVTSEGSDTAVAHDLPFGGNRPVAPEPATTSLMFLGLFFLVFRRRRM